MRYEKPMVMDLSARARPTAGQGPLGCYSGNGVVATCLVGVFGNRDGCGVGTGGVTYGNPCAAGPAPNPGGILPPLCYSGITAGSLCEFGGDGTSGWDDCTSGPIISAGCGVGFIR